MKTRNYIVRFFSLSLAVLFLSACSFDAATLYDNDAKIADTANTYNIFGRYQSHDNQLLTGTVEKMEGMITLWKYKAPQDEEIEISYLLKVTNGKSKMVLISPDGEIILIAEHTAEDESNKTPLSLSLKKGENRIKLVATQDAAIEYELEVPVGKFNG